MKIICTFYGKFRTGGIETYWLRIAKWCQNLNYKFYLALEKTNGFIKSYWCSELEKLDAETIYYRFSVGSGVTFGKKVIDHDEDITVIVPDAITYTAFCYYKTKNHLINMRIVLYILHPDNMIASNRKRAYLNKPYEKLIKNQMGKSVIFMDSDCLESAEKFYKMQIDRNAIVRVSYAISELDENTVKNRSKREQFHLMSVSRFDFAFKGYQLGLIKIFDKLVELCPNIRLTVIGTDEVGDNDEIYAKQLESLEPAIKERIEWIKRVDYEQLGKYLSKANVYIGMGSTILDASRLGVPSLIMAYGTYDIETLGYFAQHSDIVGGRSKGIANPDEFLRLIEEVYKMSDEEYVQFSRLAFDKYAELYDINSAMEKIFNCKCDDAKVGKFLNMYNVMHVKLRYQYDKMNKRE